MNFLKSTDEANKALAANHAEFEEQKRRLRRIKCGYRYLCRRKKVFLKLLRKAGETSTNEHYVEYLDVRRMKWVRNNQKWLRGLQWRERDRYGMKNWPRWMNHE